MFEARLASTRNHLTTAGGRENAIKAWR